MTYKRLQPLQNVALVHLSGSVERVLAALGGVTAAQIVPVHDFIVSNPQRAIQLLRSMRSSTIIIATKSIPFQRFRTIWKLYAAVASSSRLMFADEGGVTDCFSWSRLLAVELPLFALEVVVSLAAILVGWLRLLRYRSVCR
ncbi:MAG: hypothetical protein N2663_00820 [Chlorobi bacterium]|nr:hypothetical protein [Chlorobiota bacterium]